MKGLDVAPFEKHAHLTNILGLFNKAENYILFFVQNISE